MELSWFLDGKSLIFSFEWGGKLQIYCVNLDIGMVRCLIFEGEQNFGVIFILDGDEIVLVNCICGDYYIVW